MKKILIITSGRPNGNTAQLAEAFAKGAEEAGHQVETVSLLKTRVGGCLGCNACKRGPRLGIACVQKDGFMELVSKIRRADMLVLASPLRYWTINSRLKAFIERFYSLAENDPDPPMGRYEKYPEKDCVLLMTAADNLFWTFEQAVSYYRFAVVNYMGFRDMGMLLAGGCGVSFGRPDIKKTGYLEQAYAFGKTVYERESQNETQGKGHSN